MHMIGTNNACCTVHSPLGTAEQFQNNYFQVKLSKRNHPMGNILNKIFFSLQIQNDYDFFIQNVVLTVQDYRLKQMFSLKLRFVQNLYMESNLIINCYTF